MSDQVTNTNFLSPLNFKFQLKRAPHVNFFVQSVNVPGLSLPDVQASNPIIRVPYPGEHLEYEDLEITYRIDEDLRNYMELHSWIRSIGKRSYEEYRTVSSKSLVSGEGIRSDISLTVLTSSRNANYEVVFRDAFPVRVAGISFAATDQDVEFAESSATFKYVSYEIAEVD